MARSSQMLALALLASGCNAILGIPSEGRLAGDEGELTAGADAGLDARLEPVALPDAGESSPADAAPPSLPDATPSTPSCPTDTVTEDLDLVHQLAMDDASLYLYGERGQSEGIALCTLFRVAKTGGAAADLLPPDACSRMNLHGLAVEGAHVYWTQGGTPGTIWRKAKDGSGAAELVLPGLDSPDRLVAGDGWITWTERIEGMAVVSSRMISGGNVVSRFIEADPARLIHVRAPAPYVCWMIENEGWSLGCSPVSSTVVVTARGSGGLSPGDLMAADAAHVYAHAPGGIRRMAPASGTPAIVAAEADPLWIALAGEDVYWTDLSDDLIRRQSKDGSRPGEVVCRTSGAEAHALADATHLFLQQSYRDEGNSLRRRVVRLAF